MKDLRGELLQKARNLLMEDVEGSADLHKQIVWMLRSVVGQFDIKFRWLSCLPYEFVHADTQEGAQRILQLREDVELDRRGQTTKWWVANMIDDVKRR